MKKKDKVRTSDTTSLVDELRDFLKIDKHSLDNEIVEQPQLFFKISEAHVNAIAHRDWCKEEVSRVDADLAGAHRRKIEKTGARATDAAVSAAVAADPQHQAAVDAHMKARTDADLLGALKEAFSQRSYMLRDLAALAIANYYEKSSIEGDKNTKEFQHQKKLDRMAEARRQVGKKSKRVRG